MSIAHSKPYIVVRISYIGIAKKVVRRSAQGDETYKMF